MPNYKILVKFKEKDNFVSAFGWGDVHNNYGSSAYEAEVDNDRKFSKRAVVCFNKAEAYKAIAEYLGISVSKARKNYELRRRKEPYNGKKDVGEWVADSDYLGYRRF